MALHASGRVVGPDLQIHRNLDLYKSHSFNDEHVSEHPSSYSLTHLSMYNSFDCGQQRKVDESLLFDWKYAPDHCSTRQIFSKAKMIGNSNA